MVSTASPARNDLTARHDLAIRRIDVDDHAQVAAWAEIKNAADRVDAPWEFPITPAIVAGYLRYGWDLEPPDGYLAVLDGVPVGIGGYETSEYDNQHLAWFEIVVHPDHRRQGVGSALFDVLAQRARDEGRTSVGAGGWESEVCRAFATRHGLEPKLSDINRRQELAAVDLAELDSHAAQARAKAAEYDVVRYPFPTPEEDLAAVAVMVSAINDAPTGDLEIEDEEFPPERIRGYETAMAARGTRLHRVVARHRSTGELAGQTVVAVEADRPEHAEQHDTSVVAAHRGHRLGLLLKTEMLHLLAEEEPQVRTVDTWNAESNAHMIEVNELLGYRVLGRVWEYQRPL